MANIETAMDILEKGKKALRIGANEDKLYYLAVVEMDDGKKKIGKFDIDGKFMEFYSDIDMFKRVWKEYNSEKWKPKGQYCINKYGEIERIETLPVGIGDGGYGLEDMTKKLFEFGNVFFDINFLKDNMFYLKRAYKILSWLSESDDKWYPLWNNSMQKKYFVYYNFVAKEWNINYHTHLGYMNVIYMSESNAKKMVNMLNKKEFELE